MFEFTSRDQNALVRLRRLETADDSATSAKLSSTVATPASTKGNERAQD